MRHRLALLYLLVAGRAGARPATDVLHFKNGDKWICELKKLDHGYQYVGLDYVDGTVSVVSFREVCVRRVDRDYLVPESARNRRSEVRPMPSRRAILGLGHTARCSFLISTA